MKRVARQKVTEWGVNEKLVPIRPHLKHNVNTILILRVGKRIFPSYLSTKKLQTSVDWPSCKREYVKLSRAVDTKNNMCNTNCIHTAADSLVSEQQ
jgi:hypothetical protein